MIKKNYLFDLFIYMTILSYLLFIGSLISPSRHVDPDFFQFLGDSRYYLNWQLPPFIQSLPANPILIGVFSKLAHDLTEIEISLWINAILTSGSIFIFYQLVKEKWSNFTTAIGIALLLSHPLVFASAASNNSEVLFSFFILIVLRLIKNNKIKTAMVVSALGVLIRYEAVLIPIALAISQMTTQSQKNWTKIIRQNLLFSVIALPILFILLTRNETAQIASTPFLVEVKNRMEDIPEMRFLTHFPFALFYQGSQLMADQSQFSIIFGTTFWLLILLQYSSWKKTEIFSKTSLFFCVLFLGFHTLFPAYLSRYFVPSILTFIVFAGTWLNQIKLNKKTTFLIIIGIFLVLIRNYQTIFPNHRVNPKLVFDNAEYYTAELIKKNVLPTNKYLLISPYPETLQYYYQKINNIDFKSVNQLKKESDCADLSCAIEKIDKDYQLVVPYNSLFKWAMTSSYDHSLKKWYESIGLYELGELILSEKFCLWRNATWPEKYIEVKVYTNCEK